MHVLMQSHALPSTKALGVPNAMVRGGLFPAVTAEGWRAFLLPRGDHLHHTVDLSHSQLPPALSTHLAISIIPFLAGWLLTAVVVNVS